MKTRTILAGLLSVLAVSAAWAYQADDEKNEQGEKTVTLGEVPRAAQAAIKTAAGASTVDGVEVESSGGTMIYEASWKVNGVEHEVSVDSAGEVLETEHVVSQDAVPVAVRSAVAKHLPRGKSPEFELKSVILYSVEAMVGSDEVELLIDPAGRLIELEVDDDGDLSARSSDDEDDDGDDAEEENDDDDDEEVDD